MASNYRRKSASSASNRGGSGSRTTRRSPSSSSSPSRRSSQNRSSSSSSYRAIPGGQYQAGQTRRASSGQPQLSSVRVGDLERRERQERAERTQRAYRRYLRRILIVVLLVLALVVAAVVLYNSSAFTIESVQVSGVEHLTTTEMEQLAGVPEGTTLLRVDTGEIKSRLLMDAWVEDVTIKRSFPNTLQIIVTERSIAAVVDVPTEDASDTQEWAIASDGMWLMPIPDQDSEAGQNTSEKVYEDAASVLHITEVPYGVDPEVGDYCSDSNVNNALSIIEGMTTDLSGQVTTVMAAEAESTTLVLESGVEIVFGEAEDIRDKERVCLEIMEEHPDVVYINVRVVDSPTWRSVS